MKNLVEFLSMDEKEKLKNCYVFYFDNLYKLIENEHMRKIKVKPLTAENFKVIFVTDNSIQIATLEDITFYNPECKDFDFKIGDEEYFVGNGAPAEVIEFLDKELNKAQYE